MIIYPVVLDKNLLKEFSYFLAKKNILISTYNSLWNYLLFDEKFNKYNFADIVNNELYHNQLITVIWEKKLRDLEETKKINLISILRELLDGKTKIFMVDAKDYRPRELAALVFYELENANRLTMKIYKEPYFVDGISLVEME